MRGKKYNDDVRERALAMLAVNNSISYVAREMGLPRSTLVSWTVSADKEARESGGDTLEDLREQRKERFINSAWDSIDLSMELIHSRLERAVQAEEKLDAIIDRLSAADLPPKELRAAVKELNALKVEDLRTLVVVLGTLYDKQALASKEATAIIDGSMKLTPFEDL